MSPIPPDCSDCACSGGGGGCCPPTEGDPGQFLGVDSLGDPAWLTAPYTSYVYDSSEPATVGNVFNDWADLMVATAAVAGPKTITFRQDETLPAGAWDLTDIFLVGNGNPFAIGVEFPTGVTITSWLNGGLDKGIHAWSSSTAPIMTIGPGTGLVITANQASAFSATTEVFFDVDGAANIFAFGALNGGTLWNVNAGARGGYEVAQVGVGAVFAGISLSGNSPSIDDDTLRGAGMFVRLVQTVVTDLTIGATQTNLAGGYFDSFFTTAAALAYDPSTSGGVLTSTTVQAAIDELAGLV